MQQLTAGGAVKTAEDTVPGETAKLRADVGVQSIIRNQDEADNEEKLNLMINVLEKSSRQLLQFLANN